jgi:hypothetical protein
MRIFVRSLYRCVSILGCGVNPVLEGEKL